MKVVVSPAVADAIHYWTANGYTVRYEGKWRHTDLNSWVLITPKGRERKAFDSDLLLAGETWD